MRDPLYRVAVKYKLALTVAVVALVAYGVGGSLMTSAGRSALEREILARLETQAAAHALWLEGRLGLLARRLEDFASDGYIRAEATRLARERDARRAAQPSVASVAGDGGDGDDAAALAEHLRANKLPLVRAFTDLVVYEEGGARLVGVAARSAAARARDDAAVAGALAVPRGGEPWRSDLVEAEASSDLGAEAGLRFALATPLYDLARERRVGTLVAWVHVGRWLAEAHGEPGLRALPARASPARGAADAGDAVRVVLRDGAGQALRVPWWYQASATPGAGAEEGLGLRLLRVGDDPAEAPRVDGGARAGSAGRAASRDPAGALERHEGPHRCADGRAALGHALAMQGGRWSVLVETDAEAALSTVSGLRGRFLGVGAAVAALCGLLLLVPLRFLAAPLTRLEEAARRMQQGGTRERVPVEANDEIGRLAGAFNHMAEAVEQRQQRLEQAARDLALRKDELRTERDRLDLVIRSMSDGLVLLDQDGAVVLSNQAAEPLLEALRLGGVDVIDRHCPEGAPPPETCARCLRDPAGPPRACVVDVGAHVLEVRTSPLWSNDFAAGRVIVSRDITERLHDEGRQLHQERLAVVGEVAAVVAHELNNPLASILLYVQMLAAEVPDDSALREPVDVIARNAETCRRTIRGLLDYARAAEPEVAEVDLATTIEDAARFLRPLARRARVALTCEARGGDLTVQGDEVQLRQALVNLLLNAVQAAAGGHVRVSTRVEARTGAGAGAGAAAEVLVTVEDDGPGIPADVRARIFDTFFTTKRPGVGTGLGLAIARRIAQAHGGSLELERSQPGGTAFTIRLPIRAAPARGRLRPLPLVRA